MTAAAKTRRKIDAALKAKVGQDAELAARGHGGQTRSTLTRVPFAN